MRLETVPDVSINPERLGLAGNWNRCVEMSRTEWVTIFHQDDIMRPGHLAAHLAAFEADPTVGLVASASGVVDAEGHAVPASVVEPGGCGPVDRVFSLGEFVAELAVGNPLRCSAVIVNADAHAEVGGFDPSYRYVVNWDYWLRVARLRAVAWLARPTVDVRWHPASETHRFSSGTADLEETARFLEKIDEIDGPTLSNHRQLRKRADKRLARAYLNRAYVASKAGNPPLARRCLARAIRLWPGILGTIALDPRLAARLALATVAPGRSGE